MSVKENVHIQKSALGDISKKVQQLTSMSFYIIITVPERISQYGPSTKI